MFFTILLTITAIGYSDALIENVAHNVIRDPGGLYWTTRQYSVGINLLSSYDFSFWMYNRDIFDARTTPAWAINSTFEDLDLAALTSGDIRIYFAAKSIATGNKAISVAFLDAIDPPKRNYSTLNLPLLEEAGNDYYSPSLILPSSGIRNETLVLMYTAYFAPWLSAVNLTSDGLQVVGKTYSILEPSLEWEQGVLTRGWSVHKGDFSYIFYYGSDGSTVGVARSKVTSGPYEKLSEPLGRFAKAHMAQYAFASKLEWRSDGWPQLKK